MDTMPHLPKQTGEIAPMEGAETFLSQLRAAEWAVVTSAPRELSQHWLAAAGLPVPDLIIGADQVSRSKPDPEGYALAASLLGSAPERAIVFEDAEAGLNAGRAAGAKSSALEPLTTLPIWPIAGLAIWRGCRLSAVSGFSCGFLPRLDCAGWHLAVREPI